MIPYFAYGTTQRGFTHHRRLADLLGEPVEDRRRVRRRDARGAGHAPPHDVIDPLYGR